MSRRSGRGRTKITPPADQVSTTLIYPMHMVTGSQSNAGLAITLNASVPLAQQAFQVKDTAGTLRFTIPPAGGPKTSGRDMRAYNSSSGSYVAFRGRSNPPCVELPDGTTNQGSRIWSGTSNPTTTTVPGGEPRVGDYYFRRRSGSATQVLYVCTVAPTGAGAGTWTVVI